MSKATCRQTPGQLACGYYGLPPDYFGVLVDPTLAERERHRRHHPFVEIRHVSPRTCSLDFDLHARLCRDEPMTPDAAEIARALFDLAAKRWLTSRRRVTVISTGPTCWGLSSLHHDDALPLALVLAELWRGKDNGARALLSVWQDDRHDDANHKEHT